MSKSDGGPAFPTLTMVPQEGWFPRSEIVGGMSMRDYFAASALQGICASGTNNRLSDYHCAARAYQCADAMLAERAK